jgi:hypothetical protein
VVKPKLPLSKPPVVALEFNQQDIPLSVVKPKRSLSKTPVVAVTHNQQDTLSVVKPKRPLPSTTLEETPSMESDVTVPLPLADLPTPLPRTHGEDQRDKNDGHLRVLPPRDPPKVIRRKVLRKSRKKETVDQAKPQTPKSTPIMSTPAVSMINSIAFEHLIKQRDVQVFQVCIAELSQESLQSESPESQPDLHLIPEEYRAEFAKVFSKKEAEVLPQHRSYDHTIVL